MCLDYNTETNKTFLYFVLSLAVIHSHVIKSLPIIWKRKHLEETLKRCKEYLLGFVLIFTGHIKAIARSGEAIF